jgi:GPH family glycoside/pentoside/hexuronide:cation symporter
VGCFLAATGLPFLLAVNPGWGDTNFFGVQISRYFWFMLASSAIYLPMVSCFNMPYQSLGNEMTPDYHERTMLFSFKNAIQKIPEVGLFYFGRFFSMAVWVEADRGDILRCLKRLLTTADAWRAAPEGTNPNTLVGAQVYLMLCGFVMLVVGLISIALVRERYYGKVVALKQTKISIKETLWQTLRCRPFRIQLYITLAYQMGLSMVGTLGFAATVYYVCLGNKPEGNSWNFWMGVMGMVLGLLGIPVFAAIARRLGKRHAMWGVLITAAAVFVATWWLYTPKIVWLQIFASGMIAFTGAGFWLVMGSIGADVMDYDELEGGRRREGSFAACNSWIFKFGMAFGAGISFFILDWVGLNNDIAIQSAHTIFMIRFLLAAIPIAGLIIGMIALARFPLTQAKMAEIRVQLEARRGKV